jgi:hypothetical protein
LEISFSILKTGWLTAREARILSHAERTCLHRRELASFQNGKVNLQEMKTPNTFALEPFGVLDIFTIYHPVIFFGRWTLSAFTNNEILSTKEGYICLCYESRNSSKLKYRQLSPEGLSPIAANITCVHTARHVSGRYDG